MKEFEGIREGQSRCVDRDESVCVKDGFECNKDEELDLVFCELIFTTSKFDSLGT